MFHDLVPIAGMVTGLLMTDHLEDEVLELRDAVAGLADELRETQERLDFTERMLSAGSDRGAPVIEETGSTSSEGI